MDQTSLLDTIQKLLALGTKNPNEHEARAAMAKAQELLSRHNLSMAEVTASQAASGGPRGAWTHECVMETAASDVRLRGALAILSNHYFVRCISEFHRWGRCRVGPVRVVLFGRPGNVAVATHVLHYLLRTADDLYRGYRRRTGSRRQAVFLAGLFAGLDAQLQAGKRAATPADCRALVAIEGELDRALREEMGPIGRSRRMSVRGSEADWYAGEQAGKRIRIHDAVQSTETPLLAAE